MLGISLIRRFMLIIGFTMALLVALIWYTWRSHTFLRILEIQHTGIVDRISDISYFGEAMSNSAEMAALTCDIKNKADYLNFKRIVDDATDEKKVLFHYEHVASQLSTVRAANDAIAQMEIAIFDLIEQGRCEQAKELAKSEEFVSSKQEFRDRLRELNELVYRGEQKRLKNEQLIAMAAVTLIALATTVIFFTWLAVMRILKRYIIERRETEDRLRKSEEKYRLLFESNPHPMWVFDTDNLNFMAVNDAAVQTYGYDRDEFLSMTIKEIRPPEDIPALLKSLAEPSTSTDSGGIWRHRKKNGTVFFAETLAHTIDFENKKAMIVLSIDITERKKAEDSLSEEKNLLRILIDNIPDYIYAKDLQKRFVLANKATAELMGAAAPENMIGKTDFDFYPEARAVEYSKDEDQVLTTQIALINKEESTPAVNGRMRWFLTTKIPLHDRNENLIGLVGISRDITSRKKEEDEKSRLVKMLAFKNKDLESIIYVASHDLRASLVNIQGFSKELSVSSKLLTAELQKANLFENVGKIGIRALSEEIPEALGFIQTSAKMLDTLLNGLLKLSRLGRAAMTIEILDMNQIIKHIVYSMEYKIKEANINVIIEPMPDCLGDPSQINQVFSNLIDNAIKYRDKSRQAEIRISGETKGDESIYCVKDNGVGIAAEHQDKIFEIFHRLSPDGIEGEGLGLTIVRRILDRHNGKIWLESEPGKGSIFFVSLKKTE